MAANDISFESVDQAIAEAIVRIKANKPVDHILAWINDGQNSYVESSRLTAWAYETNSFIEFPSYPVYLTSEGEIFKFEEDLLDYYEEDDLKLTTEPEILEFYYKAQASLWFDACTAPFIIKDDLYLTAICEPAGKGFYFTNFNIFKSLDDYVTNLKLMGYIVDGPDFSSHSSSELVAMFRKNVTQKYFPEDMPA